MQIEQGVYAQWADQPVVLLQVASADLRSSFAGHHHAEKRTKACASRIEEGCEIDIYKHMILAVEEESWMDSIT